MGPVDQSEKDVLACRALGLLSKTPYACASLIPLTGGTVNFVYRGHLLSPLPPREDGVTGVTTVIVKQAATFLSANRNFELDSARSVFEEMMLNALDKLPLIAAHNPSAVKTPKLYFFDQETSTQVLEDIHDATNLLQLLNTLPRTTLSSIGHALGRWLRGFHEWTSAPDQAVLQADISENKLMQTLKSKITYEMFIPILKQHFPDLFVKHREVLEEVRAAVLQELSDRDITNLEDNWGLVHGDFWMGNVLLSVPHYLSSIHVIDFEFAHLNNRAIDLGQMIGDMLERHLLRSSPHASPHSTPLLQSFIAGYGPMLENLAYRAAIHVGIHLIGVLTRRDQGTAWPWPKEEVRALMEEAVICIVGGWCKDREWFQKSVLAPLFDDS